MAAIAALRRGVGRAIATGRHEPRVRAVPRPLAGADARRRRRDRRCASSSSASTSPRSARASPRSTVPSRSGGSCARRRRWSTAPATRTGHSASPRPRCSTPSACGPASARRGSSSCSRSSATRRASAARPSATGPAAIQEMRSLGDRRATAELLLTDTPTQVRRRDDEPDQRRDDADQGDRLGRGSRAREAEVESAARRQVVGPANYQRRASHDRCLADP